MKGQLRPKTKAFLSNPTLDAVNWLGDDFRVIRHSAAPRTPMPYRYRSRTEGTDRSITRRHFLRKAGLTAGSLGIATLQASPAEGAGAPSPSSGPLIILPRPSQLGGRPLLETLRDRATQRDFSPRPLPGQVLSDLLWAGFGVNRPETGQRTAPSAMDNREIDVLVATEAGVFLFEPLEHRLRPMSDEDLRPLTGGQGYVRVAPVSLVYLADHRRQGRVAAEEREFYAAADTGFIGQNVYLFCASEGLASVVHVVPQPTRLTAKLGCVPEQKVILAQCVGYPSE
jgi:hypothetical protein